MKNKISAIILTKDEKYNLVDCINHIKEFVDEIIVIDSSEDDITRKIAEEMGCSVYECYIGKDGINGFDDLRNYGHKVARNNWCLHVDVDEIFSDVLLGRMEFLVNSSEYENTIAYTFPRINLPFYEKYPDHQTRLVNKKYVNWKGKVHESINVNDKTKKIITIDDNPIIHKDKKNKVDINLRWNNTKSTKHILIISMFKNSGLYIDRFLNCMDKMINYSIKNDYAINLCFVESDSNDNTHEKLKSWLIEHEKIKNIPNIFVNINISDKLDRFDKLAILRNMSVKLGLKDDKYMLIIDSDVIFDKDLLDRLFKSMKKINCDVMSPLVFIEKYRDYGNLYFYDTLAFIKNGKRFNHFYPYVNEKYIKELENNNNIIEVDSVGTCYLIKSEIFNINDFSNWNVLKCYKEINKNGKKLVVYEGNGISEQISFFENVRNVGYKVAVDMNIKILHVNLETLGMKWH